MPPNTLYRIHRGARFASASIILLLAACTGGGGGGGGMSSTADPSTAPGLTVNPTSVSFVALQNGPIPPTQDVQITISRQDAVVVSADFPPGVAPPTWLDQSDSRFTGSGDNWTLTGAILTTSLAPGTYTTTLRVTIADSADKVLAFRDVQLSYTIQPLVGPAASPQSFGFTQLQGGPVPAAQILGLSDLGGGSYAWNASISYQSGNGWLKIDGQSTASGTSLPALLSLGVNSSSTLGTLNAIVRITGNGKSIDVPVSFTVSPPQITASVPGLNFNTINLGPLQAAQNLALITQGGVPVDYTTSVSYGAGATDWLTVPASGTAPGSLSISVSANTLPPGTYMATVVLTTASQTVSLEIINTVQPTSLIVPGLLGFVISPAAMASALTLNLNIDSSGAPLNWTASVSVPWLTVSPTTGTTGTTVTLSLVPEQVDSLPNGFRQGILTFTYTPPNGTLTTHQQTVDFTLILPTVTSVTPYVATSGTTEEVILRGDQLHITASLPILFGSTQIPTHTIVSETEIRVTPPSLTAGSYRVSVGNRLNNPNIVRSAANLVVVDPPAYPATTIAYPPATPASDGSPFLRGPRRIIYDAERKALIVGVFYSLFVSPTVVLDPSPEIYRYAFSGSAWSSTPTILPVAAMRDLTMTLDGKKLLVTSDKAIKQFDPVTLAAGSSTSAMTFDDFLDRLAIANDGTAIVAGGISGNAGGDAFKYSVLDGIFTPFPIPFSVSGGNVGASADGSRVVLIQQGIFPEHSGILYNASTGVLSATGLVLNAESPVLDRRGTRISIGRFPSTGIYDSNFQLLGTLPDVRGAPLLHSMRADWPALSPNGLRAYSVSGATLHTYDLSAAVSGVFPEIGTGTSLPSDPGGDNIAIAVSPDGGTLFIAGSDSIVVIPAP
jgi:IPT/TIG domain-containing protein/BACON domain-containing protein